MNPVRAIGGLAARSLLNRRGTIALTLVSIAVSVALLTAVHQVRAGARASFASTLSETDLIVGARSAPLQLLLYSVFRLGEPTRNLSWQSYERISASPDVAWSIPISLGDSHRGFRVLGTDERYLAHYRFGRGRSLELAAGRWFENDEEVVLGATVAASLGYTIGSELVLAHGIGATSFHHHDRHPFLVTGILAATGTPVDETVHVALAAIDRIHDGETGENTDHPASLTAFFLGLESRTAILRLQRAINEWDGEPLTAVIPGVALQQLWSLVRVAEQALLAVSAGVVVAGLLGMLAALLTSLNERRREMAILRAVGARPWHLVFLLMTESAMIALAGSLAGVALAHGGLALLSGSVAAWLRWQPGLTTPGGFEIMVIAVVTALAVLLALWPAVRAYRDSLADGLNPRL